MIRIRRVPGLVGVDSTAADGAQVHIDRVVELASGTRRTVTIGIFGTIG